MANLKQTSPCRSPCPTAAPPSKPEEWKPGKHCQRTDMRRLTGEFEDRIGCAQAELAKARAEMIRSQGSCSNKGVLLECLYLVVSHYRIEAAVSYHLHYLGQEPVSIRRIVGNADYA